MHPRHRGLTAASILIWQRGLTAEGRQEIERLARRLAEEGVTFGEVIHSDKARARQSAEIMAGELAPEVVNGLLFISGPFYFLIFIVGALFMWMYRLNEKRHAEILAILEERRGAREPE